MADGKNPCAGTLADLLNGGKPGKVLAEDIGDKEQAVTGIRDDEIREDSVGMSAAFTEYTEMQSSSLDFFPDLRSTIERP